MSNPFDNSTIREEIIKDIELPAPRSCIIYKYEFDFKQAATFCKVDNSKITCIPKVGDSGFYPITATYIQTEPVALT